MLQITGELVLDEAEIEEEFLRASGPGGQNVNKVETAVQLRFDVLHSPSLPDSLRQRLLKLAGKRLSEEGILVITARSGRSQSENNQLAYARLLDLLRRAAVVPKTRRPTRPGAGAKAERLAGKRRRSGVKQTRQRPTAEE
jgi:ribosome-associated protein